MQVQIKAGSHKLAATITGPASPRTFVLVHGIGMSSRYFGPLMTELSRDFRVVAIDLPGFGDSSRPPQALSITELASVLAHAIAQEQWPNPILVGQSMGCQIVSQLLHQHPGIAVKAVLIAPTTNAHERTAWQQAFRLLQDTFCEPLPLLAITGSDYLRCGIPRYLATLRHMLADHIEDRLATCPVNALIIRGSRDHIVPQYWAKQLASMLPRGQLAEINHAPHLVQFTNATPVAELCAKFATEP